MVINS